MKPSRTIWQAMNNEESGVPLVHNAANLEHFFSKRGYTYDLWSDERGSVRCPKWPSEDYNSLLGNQVRWGGGGTRDTLGQWANIPATSDVLMVISGHRTEAGPTAGENPSLTVRMGADGQTGSGSILTRATAVIQNGGDEYRFNDETEINRDSTPGTPARVPPEDGSHYIMINALERGTDEIHTVTWTNAGYDQNDTTDISGASIGELTPKTVSQGAPNDNGDCTFVGYFYAFGIWVFPDGLPSDFREAGLSMGMVWKNGVYTFWPNWV